ncbi:hypothetical protein L1987_32914 [Smallanthus sonchifolius]|uniref:Uncharacterized protein n=1 Tax=Smallanthus sonchifolius TaxID=185202 RepID=A0ACB9HQE6_9ASTR|nr:hypothetical protein L1987_32914 [Smallanthus sonchifolius]
MSTISVAIPVYASDEDYSPATPLPSPVRVTPAPPTQQPQPPLVVYQRRNRKRSAPEPAAVGEPARPLRLEDTYHWRFIPEMIQMWAYRKEFHLHRDRARPRATYVDLTRGDLQATDDVHNNLVDLVLEMKNEMANLTRRVEVAEQRVTDAEETIVAMMTGSSDT